MILKVIVWGLLVCLLLLTCSMCFIACDLPYGQTTVTTNLNSSIINTLLVHLAGILALFAVALKELLVLPKSEKKDEEKKD